MTITAPRTAGRPAWIDDLLAVPVRYWLLALTAAFLVWAGHLATPLLGRYVHYADTVSAFFGGLWQVAGILLALAPLVALRSVVAGAVLGAAPFLLVVFGEHRWPFVAFVSLLTVALCGTWRSPRLALVPAGLALVPIVVLVTGHTTMVMPYGAEIVFRGSYLGNGHYSTGGFAERGTPLIGYAVAVAAAYGLGMWMRSSALRTRRLTTLTARAGAVEEQSAVVAERARLARDLHDVVAHHVSLIAVRAETAPYTHPDLPDEARGVLAEIAGDARAALDELRGVLGVLRRADTGGAAEEEMDRVPQPDLDGVAALVERARSTGTDVRLDGDLRAPVSGPVGYVAYRVVQEALTNARRHAPGTAVSVAVLGEGDRLRVRVTNPYLQPTGAPGGRSGLVGMRERVEALGGRLSAGVEGDLFVVEADLPRGAA